MHGNPLHFLECTAIVALQPTARAPWNMLRDEVGYTYKTSGELPLMWSIARICLSCKRVLYIGQVTHTCFPGSDYEKYASMAEPNRVVTLSHFLFCGRFFKRLIRHCFSRPSYASFPRSLDWVLQYWFFPSVRSYDPVPFRLAPNRPKQRNAN